MKWIDYREKLGIGFEDDKKGIVYDELSDEDKEVYEDTFEDENGELSLFIFNISFPDMYREIRRIPVCKADADASAFVYLGS